MQQSSKDMSTNSLANKKDMRRLLKTKYLYQFLTVFLVLGVVITAAYLELIDRAVTGTLLGTAIGSTFRFAYQNRQQSSDQKHSNHD